MLLANWKKYTFFITGFILLTVLIYYEYCYIFSEKHFFHIKCKRYRLVAQQYLDLLDFPFLDILPEYKKKYYKDYNLKFYRILHCYL